MKKSTAFITIKKNAEFKRVFDGGKEVCAANSLAVVYIMKNGLEVNRFGIIASKKVGKAVVRNKARRRIREILRAMPVFKEPESLIGCYDTVIVVRKGATEASFKELETGVENLVKRLTKRGVLI